jgi:predicted transcriptional regulator
MIEFNEMIRRARVLASPTRVAIWNALGPDGRHPVALAREFNLAPSTLSYHLAILVKAKLAKVYGHGSSRVYMWSGTRLAVITDKELSEITSAVSSKLGLLDQGHDVAQVGERDRDVVGVGL